jgi:hypothetical protein
VLFSWFWILSLCGVCAGFNVWEASGYYYIISGKCFQEESGKSVQKGWQCRKNTGTVPRKEEMLTVELLLIKESSGRLTPLAFAAARVRRWCGGKRAVSDPFCLC